MPEISRFFGIIIRMYFDDHPPPHFHAIYGEYEAKIGIDPIGFLRGSLPPRAAAMVIEWAVYHQQALRLNWHLLETDQAAHKIEPL